MKNVRNRDSINHLPYSTRLIKVGKTPPKNDFLRWISVVPLVWLLIFSCGALSTVGSAHSQQLELTSNLQADYAPWMIVNTQAMRSGFIEDIQYDYSQMGLPSSMFLPPDALSVLFFEDEINPDPTIEVGTPTHTPPPSIPSTATSTGAVIINPTYSPIPSQTDVYNPTATMTSAATNIATSTGTISPSVTFTVTPSSTPSPTMTSSPTPTPSRTATRTPTSTRTPTATASPYPTSSPTATQSVVFCDPFWNPDYDYLHAHTPYLEDDGFGFVVHALPMTWPDTDVIVTKITITQDSGNPETLTVNKIKWWHPGMGSTTINVYQTANSVTIETNLPFYACLAAGQCDHSLYGGLIEVEFDSVLKGEYDMKLMVDFPEYNQTCRVGRSVETD
jgi:hypothetical protein